MTNNWVEWLFNVTCNEISVIYVTAHRCACGLKKKLNLRFGSQRHKHFAGFFNVPVQAPTRGHPFYGYYEKPPHLIAFYDTLGIRRTNSHLKPPRPPRGNMTNNDICSDAALTLTNAFTPPNERLPKIILDYTTSWVDWLLNVTFNDISVIYVTAHRCAGGRKKKLDLRLGS